ncbi:UNVERIFIED_CONTAM: hypothetical protein K2H54_050789 [Gekko kuhli]
MPYSLGYSELDIRLKLMRLPFRRMSYAPEPGIQRFRYPIEVADDAVQTEEQDDRGNNGTPKGASALGGGALLGAQQQKPSGSAANLGTLRLPAQPWRQVEEHAARRAGQAKLMFLNVLIRETSASEELTSNDW